MIMLYFCFATIDGPPFLNTLNAKYLAWLLRFFEYLALTNLFSIDLKHVFHVNQAGIPVAL